MRKHLKTICERAENAVQDFTALLALTGVGFLLGSTVAALIFTKGAI